MSAGLGGVLLGVLVFVYCKYKRGSCLARKNRTRRDYYAVTKGFPLVSAPVAESEFDDFKGANASAPMYQDEVNGQFIIQISHLLGKRSRRW